MSLRSIPREVNPELIPPNTLEFDDVAGNQFPIESALPLKRFDARLNETVVDGGSFWKDAMSPLGRYAR